MKHQKMSSSHESTFKEKIHGLEKKLKGVKNLRREESSHDIHKTRKFTRIKTKAAAKSSEE